MKLPKVIALVLTMHVAVIGVLLLSPGCKTTSSNADSGKDASSLADSGDASETSTVLEPDSNLDPAFNAGFSDDPDALPSDANAPRIVQSNTPRLPPTRPEQNLYGSESVIDSQQETMSAAAAPVRIREVSDPVQLEKQQTETSSLSYTVKSGDSFWKISRKFNVKLDELLSANNMTRNSIIRPGQVLEIPGVPAPSGSINPVVSDPIVSSSVSTRQSVSGMTYTVLPGDTLSEIAKVHNVSVAALRSLNGISGNRIIAGQDLILPAGATMPELKVKTNAPASRVANIPAGAMRDGLTHKIVSGDTLSGIAKKYGVSVKEIQNLNGITDPRKLSVGKVLLIKQSLESVSQPSTTSRNSTVDRANEIMFDEEAPPVTELRRLEE